MKVQSADAYYHFFSSFLEELIEDQWQSASLRIFFFWEDMSFQIGHFYVDLNGNRQKSLVSIIKRGISTDSLEEGLEELKKLTIEKGLPKWNVFEFDILVTGNSRLDVYWSEEKEMINNPILEPDEDSLADALLSDPEMLANKMLRMDYTSEYSLKPYYYVQHFGTGIKAIVKEMVKEGSAFDEDDFELIDFDQPRWYELETLVREKGSEDSEFRIMLDGNWGKLNRRFTTAKFRYIYKGDTYPFDIDL